MFYLILMLKLLLKDPFKGKRSNCAIHINIKNRYLYKQLESFYTHQKSVFIQNQQDNLLLKDNLAVHLYVSQTPCM